MSSSRPRSVTCMLVVGLALPVFGQTTTTTSAPVSQPATQPAELPPFSAETFAGLRFRCIGPALMSGRISDLAVDPQNHDHYYVAVASGGVWRTTNAGTTFTPVFDSAGSYSIGCVAIDPRNPAIAWVGTGENNSQRSVGFGDGVYRTRDGGQSWENVGLRDSEHIGMIQIDPRDSDVVYVAAQGPLWRAGPERGLYKTTDGGRSWRPVLQVSPDTGISEVHLDPRDPDIVYASAYQRRRHVWTLVDGGPEAGLYKSTDAGETWRKINSGLPAVDLGRIGLAIAPSEPDVLYAIVEAADGKGGTFRSSNRGETWEKRSDYVAGAPMYYNELFVDPADAEHLYSMDTFLSESRDGARTWQRVPIRDVHVDFHALWIDPTSSRHLRAGCDGGLYETWDAGANWHFKANLPVTQFYRVAVDNATPFYNVYGGTQDNNTQGGPSRTRDRMGIANEHWFVTVGGDGFESQVDPEDPNIVYSQWQHGGLIRFDRRTGELVDIKPREAPGEEGLRWNWDAPLLISPHNHQRLYFAANRVFRSDDQGNSWTPISGDLTRQIDRNQLEVMGRIQPPDAVAKHASTSFYGNCVAMAESPLVPGLLYVGTDDGLIQVTEDGGQTWRKVDQFPGVPPLTYVGNLTASQHDEDVVFAAFNNHKRGDFRPYLLRSADRGRTWRSIVGDLPPRLPLYALAEDHEHPDLLFVGHEFGVHFTNDGGKKWLALKGGLPTICVRDLAIQRRENDLVLATFGRGIYILDDYSPLRAATPDQLAADAWLLPVKPALRFMLESRLGGLLGRGTQGASFYTAPNPPFGAVFTYYLKDKPLTRKERRHKAEKEAEKAGRVLEYPTLEQFRAEDEEREPQVLLIVQDAAGATVRRIPASREKGLHRVVWDLRYPSALPTELAPPGERAPWDEPPVGYMAPAGRYTVALALEANGVLTPLGEPQSFEVIPLAGAPHPAPAPDILAFKQRVARLQRAAQGASRTAGELEQRLRHIRQALLDTPGVDRDQLTGGDAALLARVDALRQRLNSLLLGLRGDPTRGKRAVAAPPSILERIDNVVYSVWYATAPPTQTQRDEYGHAGTEFTRVLGELRQLVHDLEVLEAALETSGAPWTPGRVPDWQLE